MKTGAEAIRALATQLPAFRQKLSDGWYQVRIAGRDAGETELSARLNEPLANGAVIHIVPRLAGAKSGGVFQVVLGAALIAVAWWNPVGWLGAAAVSGMYAAGASMILGGVAQMLAPKAGRPRQQVQITANRTPISPHWITWLPGAMFCRFCTVKCAWVSRGFSGDQHGRRRGRWSGCGDWSLMQNVLCETACGRFCHLWSVRNG